MQKKIHKNFLDNWISISCAKMSLLRTEYLSSAFSVLTNTRKIFHITKRGFFQLTFLHSVQWTWVGCCRGDFKSLFHRLPYCLSKGLLKRNFLGIYLTKLFAVPSFGDTWMMRVFFFKKMFTIWSRFQKCRTQFTKRFLFLV